MGTKKKVYILAWTQGFHGDNIPMAEILNIFNSKEAADMFKKKLETNRLPDEEFWKEVYS